VGGREMLHRQNESLSKPSAISGGRHNVYAAADNRRVWGRLHSVVWLNQILAVVALFEVWLAATLRQPAMKYQFLPFVLVFFEGGIRSTGGSRTSSNGEIRKSFRSRK